jgi:hypothetical protein
MEARSVVSTPGRGTLSNSQLAHMKIHLLLANRTRLVLILALCLIALLASAEARAGTNPGAEPDCRVEPVEYKGWHAQQISNRWMQLVVVPQNGGRLMQVTFGGHPYLFVNPKLEGQYQPPTPGKWFNYGGDKLWPLPEGDDDEQHWAGGSDILDDASFTFQKLSEGQQCEVQLTGTPDPQTGIQYVRTIGLAADSPRIRFHATMKNVSGHAVEWSMQSVSQYDTSDRTAAIGAANAGGGGHFNHDFWTFTPANPSSSYLNRYHVRFGQAENPAVSVRSDGLFTVHYVHMAAELWLDSTAGWVAVVDGSGRYAMVERFQYDESKPYPGKASVIFWTNGPEMRLGDDGEPSLRANPDGGPYYLEAELNSPMCKLRAGESCSFDTEWFPTRAGSELREVTDAGIVLQPLGGKRLDNGKIKVSGSFGVFFSGRLVAHFYGERSGRSTLPIQEVKPTDPVVLDTEVTPPGKPSRFSLHLEDESGLDRGALGEVAISAGDSH